MANNAWAEAKWIVNQLESSSRVVTVSFAPNNIPHKIMGNSGNGTFKLIYTWPDDTYISEDILASSGKGVKAILYTTSDDLGDMDAGTVLHTSYTRDEYGTSDTAFIVDGASLGLTEDTAYWIQLYPFNTENVYNTNTANAIKFIYSTHIVYAVRVNKNDSDPTTRVEYVEGSINENYTPAAMNYTTAAFDYGDWADAWFMDVKPCILNYDGTVQVYLNPDAYTYDVDGNEVTIAGATVVDGNVMVQIPQVWLKTYTDDDEGYQYYYIADAQIDEDYHAYAHTDYNGNNIPYIYMAAYGSSISSGQARSVSGVTTGVSATAANEMTYALANNQGDDVIWTTNTLSDIQLINALLLLISRTTDGQTAFGKGRCSGSAQLTGGTMNSKGLFWGDTIQSNGVKVFGIEHYYGNTSNRIAGYINDRGTQKIKLTYDMSDGSTCVGYNTTGDGYISLDSSTPSGSSGGYISDSVVNEYGWFPLTASGSSTTYEADGLWYSNSQTDYARVCGDWGAGALAGPWAVHLDAAASTTNGSIGAMLSCKPVASD